MIVTLDNEKIHNFLIYFIMFLDKYALGCIMTKHYFFFKRGLKVLRNINYVVGFNFTDYDLGNFMMFGLS